MYFPTLVFCGEGKHQLRWEGPALTAEIPDVFDAYASFFHYLAPYGLLGGLASFHETGNAGVVF